MPQRSDTRGATAPIGVILMVALTVIAATTVFVFTTVIMNQDSSIVEQAKDVFNLSAMLILWRL